MPLSREIVKKGGFGPRFVRGRGYPIFRAYILKLHLLPSMWPVLVEFRSASSEGCCRKKKNKERRRERKIVLNIDLYDGKQIAIIVKIVEIHYACAPNVAIIIR